MNKTDLINKVAELSNLTKKDSTVAVEAVLEALTQAFVEGDPVKLIGFGTFDTRKRAARKGRNPQTNEEIAIPESKTPAFKAGKQLKELVNA